MKILKRNQIIISVLALMLITVGYMTYTSNVNNTVETGKLMDAETMAGIGDAKLVNSNNTVETAETAENENAESSVSDENDKDKNNEKINTETAQSGIDTKTTSGATYNVDYFVSSRLERDKMYSQMLDTYQNLAQNNSASPEQKSISTQEITNINNRKNSIMIAENLIKNLGFEDVVIFVNESSTSVIIKAEKLSEADIAQIQNIVCREIGVSAEAIHISLK